MKKVRIFAAISFLLIVITNGLAQETPDTKCEGYGFVRGTVDFAKCMQTESNKLERKASCESARKFNFLICFGSCSSKPGSYAGQCGAPCEQQVSQQYAQCIGN
jgi:hypothetical protein